MGRRPPAILVGNAPGLDFLNSIATPVDTPVDWIDDGEGLLSWLEQAQLVPPDALRRIRAQALPGELDKVADQARSLRSNPASACASGSETFCVATGGALCRRRRSPGWSR
jgi:hypothetical protein